MAAHAGDIAELLAVAAEVLVYLRIHGIGDQILALRIVAELENVLLELVEVDRIKQQTGAAGDGLLTL